MAFENLQIARAVLHEVHLRPDAKTRLDPTYGTELIPFSDSAKSTFRQRVAKAFASDSRSAKMAIRDTGTGSVAALANKIYQMPDEEFITASRAIADKLADAQTSRAIPAGLCVIFDGTAGHPARRFVGVMKAETHSGFQKGDALQVSFIQDLFLTPQAKLYKICIFIAEGGDGTAFPADWEAYLYDDKMSSARREDAATYFHDSLLGLEVPTDSAQITRRFFEGVRDFVDQTDLDPQSKVDLHNALYTALKADQRPNLQPTEFRDNHVPAELHDSYDRAIRNAGVPDGAFFKDLSEIKTRLRVRKLSFPHNVQLSGPAEAIAEHVRVKGKEIDGERWTEVLIRGALQGQI